MSDSMEIVNRVEKSGLITLDLGDFYPKNEMVELDIKDWLWQELILKEKDFRDYVKNHDWSQYQNKLLCVFCSEDAIIPDWAYMLIASEVYDFAEKCVFGRKDTMITLIFDQNISNLDISEYSDKRILLKGCGDKAIPAFAYMKMVERLQPVVKSLMFGEACSSVPVYKKK